MKNPLLTMCITLAIVFGVLGVNKQATAKTALLYTCIGAGVVLGAWVFAEIIQNTIHTIGG